MTIEAEHYGETRRALMADPIIRDMAEGVRHVPVAELAHPSGEPRFGFMNVALRTYTARGGTIPTHIGGPAEAILALLTAPEPGEYGYESCDSFEPAEGDPGHCANCPGYDSDHDTEETS